jgi:tRNA 2-selenouridine synthase
VTDLKQLFIGQTPLLDVRAPIEFAKGSFPTAINIPILDDEQRHLVGTCYQKHGQAKAEKLGYELVGPSREQLVARWQQVFNEHPEAKLYCFRGGKRSQIATEWLRRAGTKIERIDGGYKRLRNFLLDQLNNPPKVILISGRTGVGKTELLPQVINAVDLEGLANHRGSAFGGRLTEQPAQIDFENQLAIEFLRHEDYVVLEDESRLIGRINVPLTVQEAMKRAPIYLLEDTLENRVSRILEEYVRVPLQILQEEELKQRLAKSLSAIQKRLGGVRYQALVQLLNRAFSSNDVDAHSEWIITLLTDYYDPMYDYQLNRKRDRIVQTITWSDVQDQTLLDFGPNGP